MTIDEAIKRYVDNAKYERTHGNLQGCLEFRQLVKWLKELKQLREQTKWIPCSERQPKENGNYLAFYRTSDGTASLEFMMVDHCNASGGWLHEENGRKAYKKVIAWMPLPKPYNAET